MSFKARKLNLKYAHRQVEEAMKSAGERSRHLTYINQHLFTEHAQWVTDGINRVYLLSTRSALQTSLGVKPGAWLSGVPRPGHGTRITLCLSASEGFEAREVCSFSVPAVTDHHCLSDLKPHKYITVKVRRSEVQRESPWAKIKVSAGVCSSPRLRGRTFSFVFSNFETLSLFLNCGLFVHLQSSPASLLHFQERVLIFPGLQ